MFTFAGSTDPLAFRRGDTGAVIDHLDDERVRRLGGDHHPAPRVADRVVGKVAEHPGQLVGPSGDGRSRGNGDVHADARGEDGSGIAARPATATPTAWAGFATPNAAHEWPPGPRNVTW